MNAPRLGADGRPIGTKAPPPRAPAQAAAKKAAPRWKPAPKVQASPRAPAPKTLKLDANGNPIGTKAPSTKAPKTYWPTPYESLNQGYSSQHTAWDVQAPEGSAVYSPVEGTVLRTTPMDPYGWGNVVEIVDDKGNHLYFAHLSQFAVEPGQHVAEGQEIALSGNTFTPGVGHSTGPHLHFEIRDSSGKPVDPSQYFAGDTFSLANSEQTIELNDVAGRMEADATPYENAAPASTPALESPAKSSLTPLQAMATAGISQLTSAIFGAGVNAKPDAQAQGEYPRATLLDVNVPGVGPIDFGIDVTPGVICGTLGAVLVLIGFIGMAGQATGSDTAKTLAKAAAAAA